MKCVRLISKWTEAKRIRDVFLREYKNDPTATAKAVKMCEDLEDLGENPSLEEVQKILARTTSKLGVRAPVDLRCDECQQKVEQLVSINKPDDEDSCPTCLCAKCLMDAMILIEP